MFTHELTPRPPMPCESGRVEPVNSNSIGTYAIHHAICSVAVRDIQDFVQDTAGQALSFKGVQEIRQMNLHDQGQIRRSALEFGEHREGGGDVLIVA